MAQALAIFQDVLVTASGLEARAAKPFQKRSVIAHDHRSTRPRTATTTIRNLSPCVHGYLDYNAALSDMAYPRHPGPRKWHTTKSTCSGPPSTQKISFCLMSYIIYPENFKVLTLMYLVSVAAESKVGPLFKGLRLFGDLVCHFFLAQVCLSYCPTAPRPSQIPFHRHTAATAVEFNRFWLENFRQVLRTNYSSRMVSGGSLWRQPKPQEPQDSPRPQDLVPCACPQVTSGSLRPLNAANRWLSFEHSSNGASLEGRLPSAQHRPGAVALMVKPCHA